MTKGKDLGFCTRKMICGILAQEDRWQVLKLSGMRSFFGGADPLKVSYFLGFICILVLEIRGTNAGNCPS